MRKRLPAESTHLLVGIHVCFSRACPHLSFIDAQILADVAHGASNAQIAKKRGYEIQTVANRLRRIYWMVGLSGRNARAELVGLVIRAGLD